MKFFLVSHKLGIVNTSMAPEGSNTIRTVLPSATPVVTPWAQNVLRMLIFFLTITNKIKYYLA